MVRAELFSLPIRRPSPSFAQQTFRQRGKFGAAAVRAPYDAAVGKNFPDDAGERSFEGAHAVAGLEVGGFSERADAGNHGCKSWRGQSSDTGQLGAAKEDRIDSHC